MKLNFLSALCCAALATEAFSQSPSSAYIEAGIDLTIASRCLDELGHVDLFDKAFDLFRQAALDEPGGPSQAEIDNVRTSMLAGHTADATVNMFTPPFCEDLRKRLDAK